MRMCVDVCVCVCVCVVFRSGQDRIGRGIKTDFGSHALLQKGTELALIVNLDNLLRPVGRVRNVELHLDEAARLAVKSRRKGGRTIVEEKKVFFYFSVIQIIEEGQVNFQFYFFFFFLFGV